MIYFLLCALINPLYAWQIGIGLKWDKGLYVQEVWHDGRRVWLMENRTDKPIKLKPKMGLAGQEGFELIKGARPEWLLPAGEITEIGEEGLGSCSKPCYVQLLTGSGEPLGVLAMNPRPAMKGIVVMDGLNGSGGASPDFLFEPRDWSFRDGAPFEIKMRVSKMSGDMKFPEVGGETSGVKAFRILEMRSDTLKVSKVDGVWRLDLAHPKRTQESHEVTFKLQPPKVPRAQLVMIDGWYCGTYQGKECVAGNGLAKSFVIKPQ